MLSSTLAEALSLSGFWDELRELTAEFVEYGVARVEEALGGYLCSDTQPCAAVAQYDVADKVWRIADDHTSEEYVDLVTAITAAARWAEMGECNANP